MKKIKIEISLLTLISVLVTLAAVTGFAAAGAIGSNVVQAVSCLLILIGAVLGFTSFTRYVVVFIRREMGRPGKEPSLLSITALALLLAAAAGFSAFSLIEPRFAEDGTLIEPFFLLPISYLMIFTGAVLGSVQMVRLTVRYIRAKKNLSREAPAS